MSLFVFIFNFSHIIIICIWRDTLNDTKSIGVYSSGNKIHTENETGMRERKEYLSSNELYLQQRCRTIIIVNCWKWDQMRDSINIYSRLYHVTHKIKMFHVQHLKFSLILSNWSFPWVHSFKNKNPWYLHIYKTDRFQSRPHVMSHKYMNPK